MEINLHPPAEDHWNIASDSVFPSRLEESQWQREAKELAWAQEKESKEAEASHPEEAADRGPPAVPESKESDRVLPKETAPSREQVMKTTWNILDQVPALRLQSMHKLGSIREADKILAQTLMAEFVRLQLIINEDFTKSPFALCADLETSSAASVSNIA